MSRNIPSERPWWLLPLITFLVGLLVGWWGIGWGVWPVEYTNSLPQDLRAAERDYYLMMVAESYSRDGDALQAQERLSTWPRDQLRDDLQRLQARLMNEDVLRASQVQQLAGMLGVYAPVGASGVPTPVPEPAAGGEGVLAPGSLLRTICTAVLWAALILAGIVGIIYLWNWWRRVQTANQGPAIDARRRREAAGRAVWPGEPEPSATDAGQDVEAEWYEPPPLSSGEPEAVLEPAPPWEADAEPTASSEADQAEALPAFLRDARKQPRIESPVEAPSPPARTQPTETHPPARRAERARDVADAVSRPRAAGLAKVSEFRGMYRMGESDYDEAFDITDPQGGYIGQCGLALVDPIGRDRDQAAALQVWLWETQDPDTKVEVLMSQGAYRDTALRDQLSGKHSAIPVQPGTEFELESHNVVLRGQVERLDYVDQKPMYSIFSEIVVRLEAYKKQTS